MAGVAGRKHDKDVAISALALKIAFDRNRVNLDFLDRGQLGADHRRR
jgi:hypothetical protein